MTSTERHKRWAAKNRAHVRQYMKAWRKKNKKKVDAYNRKHYKYDYAKARKIALKRKFGVSVEQYEALRRAQNGGCAICYTHHPGGKGDFHLDHDHGTGRIRGLLCQNCNIGLGNFKDDPKRLDQAAKYLRKHQEQT